MCESGRPAGKRDKRFAVAGKEKAPANDVAGAAHAEIQLCTRRRLAREGKAPMLYAYAVRFAPDWPSAACAAARRAIGTRKGEHET